MRCRWIVALALCAGLARGALGEWSASVAAAKRQAYQNGRPLLVMVGNSATCSECQAAEAFVFNKAEWKAYAQAKGIPQYFADGAYPGPRDVKSALHKEYNVPFWPTMLIFQVRATADLNSDALDAATNVVLVGRFLYRKNRIENGVQIPSVLTPANFIAVMTSFYSAAYPQWLADLKGTIQVTLAPPAVIAAGARWSIDGGTSWRESGQAVQVNPGTYDVSYNAVAGWTAPGGVAVAATAGQTSTRLGTYTQLTGGTLTVTIEPPEAVAAGRWSVDAGVTWRESGTSVALDVGSHTLTFKSITGWVTPAAQPITVTTVGQVLTATGTYTQTPTGTLAVTITPPEAAAAGARWSVNGGVSWRESGTEVTLEPDTYQVQFGPANGWTAPGMQQVEVLEGQLATATGVYTPLPTGTLVVTITPPEAVAAGARWSVGGGVWRESGLPGGLEPGSYTVTFKPVAGWTTPADQPVDVVVDETTTAAGPYVELPKGTLNVTITPPDAVTAGAAWSVDGGTTWRDPGVAATLPVGSYTVTFKPLAGWTSPANRDVEVMDGQTTNAAGTYTVLATGTLRVDLAPAGAVTAGARWSVDAGATWRVSGAVVVLPVGSYQVSFNAVAGWQTPTRQNVSVTAAALTEGSATYLKAVDGEWNPDLPAAKRQAFENDRPLLVMVGNSATCSECQAAEAGVFNKAEWQAYATAKGIPQYFADGAYPGSRDVKSALHKEYGVPFWPTMLVFRIKDTADLDSTDLDEATNVELIGRFLYRKNRVENNVQIPAVLSPANFIAVMTSFYSTTHPGWLEDLSYGDDADPDDDDPSGATPLATAAGVITNSSARTLDGADNADWFSFEAETGATYYFTAKNWTLPADVDITFSIYDGVPTKGAAPVAVLEGMAALGEGSAYTATTAGTHYAVMERAADDSVTGLAYTLAVTVIATEPEAGSITNPLWDTAAVGQWTMSYEAAAATGKPMLVLFSGIRWCPHCIQADAVTFSQQAFKDYVSAHDAVLVLIDNARRNTAPAYPTEPGPGPTLLREEAYLDANGLTAADGEAKLEANLAFQDSLLVPGATRIGYPTLLYLRPSTKNGIPSVVGRVSYEVLETSLSTVLDQLGQLGEMVADAAEEHDNVASWTTAELTPPPDLDAPEQEAGTIGGVDTVDWRLFTPAAGTGWSFTVGADPGGRNGTEAQVTVGVYDTSGTGANPGSKLAEATGSFADGVTLDFRPLVAGVVYRLSVQVSGQADLVGYTITYVVSELSYEAQFESAEVGASQQDDAVELAVLLTAVIPNAGDVELRYWTEDIPGSAQAGVEYVAVDDTLLWGADETGTVPRKTISVPLTAGALDAWEGSRDFLVHLEAVSNCKVIGIGTATVRIYCVPTFVDAPAYARTLSTSALADLRLPIANGLDGVVGVALASGVLPPGLSLDTDTDEPAAVISGRPTATGTYAAVLQARVTSGGEVTPGGQITVTLTVETLTEVNAQGVGSFVGTLYAEGQSDVRGTATLTASATGRLKVKLVVLNKSYSLSIPVWSGVDADGTTLWAELEDPGKGLALVLSVDVSGHVVGTFQVAINGVPTAFDLEMDRVGWHATANPANEYVGYYTVSLPVELPGKADDGAYTPAGGGYLVFAVTTAGKTTYSGKLADGTRFSGSTVLTEVPDGIRAVHGAFTVFAPLYSKRGYVAGRLSVVPKAERQDEVACVSACGLNAFFEWSYPGKSPTQGRTADAFTVALAPCGTAYAKGVTLADLGIEAAELLTGGAPDDAAYAYRVGAETRRAYPNPAPFPQQLGLAVDGARLNAPPATKPVRQADGQYAYNGTNDAGLKVSYSASTGVFKGSFKLYYDYFTTSWKHKAVTVKFEGVLTPIPGSCCSADPLPLGHGFFLVADNNAAAGYTFNRSYPVWLGETVVQP